MKKSKNQISLECFDDYLFLNRILEVLNTINEDAKILIFCERKKQVDILETDLRISGYRVSGMHGSKSQDTREQAINDFRTLKTNILVATDVASRGLHVENIAAVINYDFPLQIEDYVHRIGRTGRAGAKGAAYSFFTKRNLMLAPKLIQVNSSFNFCFSKS